MRFACRPAGSLPSRADTRPTPGPGAAEAVPAPLCEFYNLDVPPIPLERLTGRMASDAGVGISDWNLALIARADSLRQAGAFGPADEPGAACWPMASGRPTRIASAGRPTSLTGRARLVPGALAPSKPPALVGSPDPLPA